MTNSTSMQEKRWNSLPDIDNETILIWLENLLEIKNKMFVEELTVEEIKAEIDATKDDIVQFGIWDNDEAILDCEEYIEVLEEMLQERED